MKRLLTTVAAVGALTAPAFAEEYSLQNGFPKTLPMLGPSADYFAALVSAGTNGSIQFTHYGSGELSPPAEILDNVGARAIDAGWSFAPYNAAVIPSVELFGAIPFGPDPVKYMAWIHEGGGLELWEKAYEPFGVIPMPCAVGLPEAGGWFNKEINTAADFDGLRMRIGGIGGSVLAELGASTQSLPAGEIYTSLETGRLDATEFAWPGIDKLLGFQEIAQYYYFPGWHNPGGLIEFTVSIDLWNEWSEDQQTVIRNACRATAGHFLEIGSAKQPAVIAEFEEAGVEIRRFPDEVLDALREASVKVYEERSASDPLFGEIYASYKAFSEQYDIYQNLNETD